MQYAGLLRRYVPQRFYVDESLHFYSLFLLIETARVFARTLVYFCIEAAVKTLYQYQLQIACRQKI